MPSDRAEDRPPRLGADERERRRGGVSPLDRLDALPGRVIPRPWLHETHGDLEYRWLVTNRLMRNDERGVEITYRHRRHDDVICGARTIRPGIPGAKPRYSWRMDQTVDHEVVCTVVCDHGETPHVGVPADCGDMTCRCVQYGCYHLVIVGFAVKRQEAAHG